MFALKRKDHCRFVDSHEFAICHRDCRPHAYSLAPKATLPAEIARVQYAYGSFLAVLRDDGEPYLALLDIKHRIRRLTLSVNCLFLWNQNNFPAFTDDGKE